LPLIFSFFGYDKFTSHIIKLTRDADIDIDNDVSTSLIQKLEKGIKNRKKGKPVRFVYDREIDSVLLLYILKRLGIKEDEKMLPGGRIHNFKDFMSFPNVFTGKMSNRRKPFTHPRLSNVKSVTEEVLKSDFMLHFPYHSFDTVIDLLREAAIDPKVTSIKITCYRLASRSKIINALANAVRNGKSVTVMLELRARFDEEANLIWKQDLEEAGVTVLLGAPNEKVHAKLCIIKRVVNSKTNYYGFVSTGNLNEKTAKIYGDHLLLTSDRRIMADANKIFNYLEHPRSRAAVLQSCKYLSVAPYNMRANFVALIDKEIKFALAKKKASIIVKTNSLSDKILIEKLTEAAKAGVEVKLIVRGICCMLTENKKFKKEVEAISIIDEYLEHARVIAFRGGGDSKVFISSADWMVRNLDHRVEVACPITDKQIKKELLDILNVQLSDNVKARKLDNRQKNLMMETEGKTKVRSQIETYNYLYQKTIVSQQLEHQSST
jgi:polyphosphate kinase